MNNAKLFLKAPFIILQNLVHHRHLLMRMVWQEIRGRFAGSFGGLVWHFLQPLLMVTVYLFVFVEVFKLRVEGAGAENFSAFYIMAGLFPWLIFAEGLSRGSQCLHENANLIQKTAFPTELLVFKAVLTPYISFGMIVAGLAAYRLIFIQFSWHVLALPLVALLQFLFTCGLVFLCATLAVYFKDILQLINIFVSFGMYLVPILFPVSMLPELAQKLMYLNPTYPMIYTYQRMLVFDSLGEPIVLYLLLGWSLLFFVLGSFIFYKLKDEFADWL
ncbi:MAG: ABC transporter permease [Dissulfuribacterales bacterium]